MMPSWYLLRLSALLGTVLCLVQWEDSSEVDGMVLETIKKVTIDKKYTPAHPVGLPSQLAQELLETGQYLAFL